MRSPNDDSALPAEDGKHYVAFVVSDGDNAQYWQNTAIFSTSYMNATGRENDEFRGHLVHHALPLRT